MNKIKNNKTMLILVSMQAVPNITPILDERFRPGHIIMLVSNDMQKRSVYLEKIYLPRGMKVSRWLIDDPWDVEHIRQRVEELLLENDFVEIFLNATGGTKPMSIAAYEVFRENDLQIFYIHPELDRLIWMHPKRPSMDLADRIKLKEYLFAYGASDVNIEYKSGVKENLRLLFKSLVENIQHYQTEFSSLNYYAATADNPRLISPSTDDKKGEHKFWDLVDLFEQAQLLEKIKGRLKFPDQASRFIVNGGWLELYVYQCCLDLKTELAIQDLAGGVEVTRQRQTERIVNELDVALLKDNRLYILECKTTGKKLSKTDEVIYKLDSIRDIIGGLQAKAMLVSMNNIEKHHMDRARELNIAICCYQDLSVLKEKIKKWLLNGG